MELVAALRREAGRTIVAVLHDLNLACRYADHVVAMRNGVIVGAGAPAEIVTAERVQEVFGLECVVIDDPASHTPLVIPLGSAGRSSSVVKR